MKITQYKERVKNVRFLLSLFICLLVILPVTASAKMGAVTILGGEIIQEPENGRMWQMDRSKKMSSPAEG